MYEYNFDNKRKIVQEKLDKALAESKDKYYFQLDLFKKKKGIYNKNEDSQEKNKEIKEKKVIIKNSDNKKYGDFFNNEALKFKTFYNQAFGLFDMTSQAIYKSYDKLKLEYVIFKDCTFKNIKFENCTFIGCEFLGCTMVNTRFIRCDFFNFKEGTITYFSSCEFEGCIFDKSNLSRNIFEANNIKGTYFILSNLKKGIFSDSSIESIYFCDCDLRTFSIINSDIENLEFDDEFMTKLNENTFFDKIVDKKNNCKYYFNIYKIYKNIASQFESNRILNIAGEYHYLSKCSENKTLSGFSKFKSKVFWLTCGYGERPKYALITSFEIILIFAIIYLFTGISVAGNVINYNLSVIFLLDKKIILVDFLEALYFSLVTFTTVGYGDIVPTGVSIVLSSIEMVLGVTMVGIWTATLARKITR